MIQMVPNGVLNSVQYILTAMILIQYFNYNNYNNTIKTKYNKK